MAFKDFLKLIPKKHGAWSIFFISIITGAFCAKNFKPVPFLLLFVSSLSGFLLRENISLFLKLKKEDKRKKFVFKISLIYFFLIILTLLPLLLFYRFYLLIPISMLAGFITTISFYFSLNKKELTVPAEITGIFGLSLLLLAFYYISKGFIDKEGVFLFIFAFLFFTGSVFHVRYLVRSKNILSEDFLKRLKAGKYSLLYHTFFFIISIYLSLKNYTPSLAYIAVLPALFKSYFFVLRKLNRPLSIKEVGFIELSVSIAFALILIGIYY